MCGILGYTGQPREGQWGETYDIMNALFLASEQRGRHATGFVARAEPFKTKLASSTLMDKAPLPASVFIHNNSAWRSLRRRRCSTVVGHVRWATHGSPKDNQNNHPFVSWRGLYLVHNGVLAEHRAICERYGLRLNTECDSEAILRVVESERSPTRGLEVALDLFRGQSSMAVVIYDRHSDILYLARNDGRPFWLLRLNNDRRWFFASTREILLRAMAEVMGRMHHQIELLIPLASGEVHTLRSDGQFLAGE